MLPNIYEASYLRYEHHLLNFTYDYNYVECDIDMKINMK